MRERMRSQSANVPIMVMLGMPQTHIMLYVK